MDVFLGRVTQQAMNYAIRSGLTLTATYAIRQSNRYLSNAPKSSVRDELFALQQRLQHKIRIISPAIDMIELIAARGHTSLEAAVALTKELRLDIQSLGQRLAKAAAAEESAARSSRLSSHIKAQNELEMKLIVNDMKQLLSRIEDAIPLINLAITTSGASLSTSLPHTVSPSRLLQASTFLTAGDTQYSLSPQNAVQIGPTFTLTVYMLFAGHDRPQNEEEIRETTWKEVIHKARVKLRRVPLDVVVGTGSGSDAVPSVEIASPGPVSDVDTSNVIPADSRNDEYAYQMMIIEDLDDDRVHDFEEDQARPGPFDDVKLAGIREMIPIHEISKIFYADTSKVLNIGSDAESNHPVLLLKRDVNAVPPRRMVEKDSPTTGMHPDQMRRDPEYFDNDHDRRQRDPWRFPPSLDPEWIAFEVYTESDAEDSESEAEETDTSRGDVDVDVETSQLSDSISKMRINNSNGNKNNSPAPQLQQPRPVTNQTPPWINAIKTSLSLLELLLRLTSLQQFQQQSHLSITDELLNFFLEESATTGAGGDENYRQALRAEARRRVGWDPYDESPMKRRGEDYQYQYYAAGSPSPGPGPGPQNGAWSPREAQTRSITAVSDYQASPSQSPSPSPRLVDGARGSRASWLKRQDETARKGSPLRPQTALTDEGIGTSPASREGS
ncbi:Ran-specific GTPase-activating protein 30 [Exophiala xenobiotica]|nr:Ran-specific GTPase-activating protein 30 [Exophiala xenobiotica]KAK5247024.1 Ran-specific GTPase-activating protein 30 [Exophiala xenobiotica]KAK5346113.1 Ran-specific GTPase-activating protein 30 [Exophiala xenobiotica]KAK5359736.1 Ran-specific GTPase-activating protein 30 [Exophiala xenobiotica]KAK5365365.1 Ran-specific GTPase-activating protein 30 [Exophiala xenobiotica]